MTSCNFLTAAPERCDLDNAASFSLSNDHPGGLAQGPEESKGNVVLISVFPFYISINKFTKPSAGLGSK